MAWMCRALANWIGIEIDGRPAATDDFMLTKQPTREMTAAEMKLAMESVLPPKN